MAFSEKQLGQERPTADTNTVLYTVGASVTAVVKNIIMCNTTASAIDIRIFAVPNGGSAGEDTAVYYDYEVPGQTTWSRNHYLVLGQYAELVVYSTSQGVTFTVSGAEMS